MQEQAQLPPVFAKLAVELGHIADVRYAAAVDSTNSELKRLLQQGALARPVLLVTDAQRRGRGTRDRSWLMQPGLDIALSLILPLRRPELQDARLSLAVGAAAALALESATGLSLSVKWPNDLLAGAPGAWRKCGGILLETAPAPSGERWLCAGIGVNANSTAGMFPPELAARLTTLRDVLGQARDRDSLAAALARGLVQALLMAETTQEPAPALEALLTAWFARDCTAGARYRLVREGQEQLATAVSVDRETGSLHCVGDDSVEYNVISYTELEAI
jgi:BirA family biotin operon repressor/biotin-[acetyl-CoA-carboxylase] ligase